MKGRKLAVLLAFLALAVAQAQAATTDRDLQAMARAIGFVNGLPRGAINTAIVEGPGAQSVLAQMRGGVSAGGVTLLPRVVSAERLQESGARVIIVPEGQRASHAAIAAAANAMSAVTVTTDIGCVRAGHCVIGVSASPRVEITVSRNAARAAQISFAQAFRVMIREV